MCRSTRKPRHVLVIPWIDLLLLMFIRWWHSVKWKSNYPNRIIFSRKIGSRAAFANISKCRCKSSGTVCRKSEDKEASKQAGRQACQRNSLCFENQDWYTDSQRPFQRLSILWSKRDYVIDVLRPLCWSIHHHCGCLVSIRFNTVSQNPNVSIRFKVCTHFNACVIEKFAASKMNP